ncbi:hypothetical protein ACFLXX_04185 [Chloroflexota bacterium]
MRLDFGQLIDAENRARADSTSHGRTAAETQQAIDGGQAHLAKLSLNLSQHGALTVSPEDTDQLRQKRVQTI